LLHHDFSKMTIMKIKYTLIYAVLFACLGTSSIVAQIGREKKAKKDFNRYEYIDAREVYLKVVEKGYKSAQIYENLGDTYYWNSDYANAALWYGKLMNEFPEEAETIYFYRAAQSFKSIDEPEKSKKYMQMYVTKSGDTGMMNATATDFIEYDAQLSKVGVNSSFSDFGPAFYNNSVVFASSKPGGEGGKVHKWMNQPFTDLYVAQIDADGNLTNATLLPGDVNTKFHETSPTFSKDGKTMYFTRNNYFEGKKGKAKDKTIHLKIYKATLSSENKWVDVKELPFNNDNYSVAHPALSPDGKRLYFSSEMEGGKGMSDIWYVDILGDDNYSTPKNLEGVNTASRESFPFVSDSNKLYFTSDGRGGMGGYDVFRTQLNENGAAGQVINMGAPVNTNKDDFGFIINEEKHIGYVSSNRDGVEGSIDDDIYTVIEQCVISLGGLVSDQETNEPIFGATVLLLDENSNIVESFVVGADGLYSFTADCDTKYSVRASKQDYIPNELPITTPNKTSTLTVDIPLKRIGCAPDDLGCLLDLQPIYFDFDRYNIRPDAEIELAKILEAMNKYPQLNINIESHTDSRGNDNYNMLLSDKRAQSTLEWLVSKGIDRSRLSAKGFGESQLLNECSNGVECTEEAHQLNRRSMFLMVY
jgi:outer membrane protein OmpA-like peptidoglycan-associated protein/Tol biopolymer transport system component